MSRMLPQSIWGRLLALATAIGTLYAAGAGIAGGLHFVYSSSWFLHETLTTVQSTHETVNNISDQFKVLEGQVQKLEAQVNTNSAKIAMLDQSPTGLAALKRQMSEFHLNALSRDAGRTKQIADLIVLAHSLKVQQDELVRNDRDLHTEIIRNRQEIQQATAHHARPPL